MHETELDVVRNLLMKAYLEDFLNFCQNEIGGTTAEVMTSILEVCAPDCGQDSRSGGRLFIFFCAFVPTALRISPPLILSFVLHSSRPTAVPSTFP